MSLDGTVALNNYLQSKNQHSLVSWVDTTSGPRHAPEWTSTCKFNGEVIGVGQGAQKHVARDAAAKAALEVLTQQAAANDE
ncbi:hypothetical protein BKA93DRAFT_822997 [Sparassis latifolia]|uniref:DRBM domain-containing protein n=1 Tax=Sparassis crispa TaxID=139825 RepID=A0A401G5Q8_9APHY|nr:hypothetical protein SCP_0103640 [Sparassis crispa]GBE77489.1 hypothetical protein SCP_0103640 [Sparassis crispa]